MYVDQWGEIHPPPDPEKGKPPNPSQLGGTEETEVLGPTGMNKRLTRYGTGKARNREMAAFLAQQEPERSRNPYKRLSHDLYECCSWLALHHYPAADKLIVGRATTCKKHLLCPLCALFRGGKMVARYVERCAHLAPEHDFQLVTLTVKNGPDLYERYLHLKHSFKTLRTRGRDGYGVWANVSGAVWSTEFTHSAHGWHPHLHMVVATPKGTPPFRYGQGSPLSNAWLDVTGDSYIVHASPIGANGQPLLDGLSEVMKYALKFSDLPLDQNLHAYNTLKGRRLLQASGCFFGLVLPDDAELTDDPLDGPFIEYLFHYTSGGYRMSGVPSTHPQRRTHGT
jgi:hypothetical protein